ncbi:MAG: hypothetical protein ACO2OX_03090 [Candidatus Nanopusillus sp.]
MKENIVENTEFFYINLKLRGINMLDYNFDLEYSYTFDKNKETRYFYRLKNNTLSIEINSILNFEILSKIIKTISDTIRIIDNKVNGKVEINILDGKGEKHQIYLPDNSCFIQENSSVIKSGNILVNYNGNRIINIYTNENLKKISKILQILINSNLYFNKVRKILLTYFKTKMWDSEIAEFIKFSCYIKGGNIKIDNKMIEYFISYYIMLDKETKTNICETLFATEYGNCHVSLKNPPELTNDIVNYIENLYKNFVHSGYRYLPIEFGFNNKMYVLDFENYENNIYLTVWTKEKNQVILHFAFQQYFNFLDRINFIKKIFENKDFIVNISNKYNLMFPDYLIQLFDKSLSEFGIFYK